MINDRNSEYKEDVTLEQFKKFWAIDMNQIIYNFISSAGKSPAEQNEAHEQLLLRLSVKRPQDMKAVDARYQALQSKEQTQALSPAELCFMGIYHLPDHTDTYFTTCYYDQSEDKKPDCSKANSYFVKAVELSKSQPFPAAYTHAGKILGDNAYLQIAGKLGDTIAPLIYDTHVDPERKSQTFSDVAVEKGNPIALFDSAKQKKENWEKNLKSAAAKGHCGALLVLARLYHHDKNDQAKNYFQELRDKFFDKKKDEVNNVLAEYGSNQVNQVQVDGSWLSAIGSGVYGLFQSGKEVEKKEELGSKLSDQKAKDEIMKLRIENEKRSLIEKLKDLEGIKRCGSLSLYNNIVSSLWFDTTQAKSLDELMKLNQTLCQEINTVLDDEKSKMTNEEYKKGWASMIWSENSRPRNNELIKLLESVQSELNDKIGEFQHSRRLSK